MENLEVRDHSVIATEINVIKAHTNKILLNSAVEIGKRLKEAKQIVRHGNWENWLEKEVSYSQRTATNLMRIYEEYGSKLLENQIGNPLADLGYTQAIAMLKLDFEERENLMIEHDITAMSVKELEKAIEEKIALAEEKELLQIQIETQTEKGSKLESELKEKIQKIEEYEELVKKAKEETKKLKARIKEQEESEENEEDTEELESLRLEIESKKSEINDLKEQLKEKPTQIEVERVVEKVPEDLQEEINNLKVQLENASAKLNASESIIKFRSIFNITLNTFNDLIAALDEIEKEEPEQYEKYKAALNKFLEQLAIE